MASEKDVKRFLREEESRTRDPDHVFRVERVEKVNPGNYVNKWKAKCKYKDVSPSLGYEDEKIIIVWEDENGNLNKRI